MNITHTTTASGTDAGTGEIHKAQWNEAHTVTGTDAIAGIAPWQIPIDVYTPHGNTNWSNLTGGQLNGLDIYSSGAQNDEIWWYIGVPAGTYDIVLWYVKAANQGIYSVRVDDVQVGTIDGYNGSTTNANKSTISGVTIAAGKRKISLKMATKNGSSSNYYGEINALILNRTAGTDVLSTSRYPLDRYAIDTTYGTHFDTGALPGIFTRRNFTSGAESYQQGPDATYMRIAFNGRAVGDGYFESAPAGDWTFATAFIPRFYDAVAARLFGIAVVDTAGTGVWLSYGNGSPQAFDLLQLTTYTTYGGSYVEAGYNGASPNISYMSNDVPSMHRKMWLSLRKSGTNYYASFSLDGELWGVESSALSWAGTVDRIGLLYGPLSGSTLTNGYVDMDWFNKIA